MCGIVRCMLHVLVVQAKRHGHGMTVSSPWLPAGSQRKRRDLPLNPSRIPHSRSIRSLVHKRASCKPPAVPCQRVFNTRTPLSDRAGAVTRGQEQNGSELAPDQEAAHVERLTFDPAAAPDTFADHFGRCVAASQLRRLTGTL